MSAMTMTNEYGVEQTTELATHNKPVATPVAEPAKETKMETTATLPASRFGNTAFIFSINHFLQTRNNMSMTMFTKLNHNPTTTHFMSHCTRCS